MIEDEECFFDGRLLRDMIDGRAGKKQNKTEAVNTCTYDARCVAMCGSNASQYRKATDAKYNTNRMYQSIYDFLFPCVACW